MHGPHDVGFPDRYVHREAARRIYGDLADAYALSQLRGDPLADDVVRWMACEGPSARATFERALCRGITAVSSPPDALVALFAQLDRVPEWVDWERVELGARTYQRIGPATLFILSAWSLMNGYHCGPAVKPLAFTRQLEAMAPRRLAETGRFVTEVAQVGGMHRHARGFEIAVRVRMIHSHVRISLERSRSWRTSAWGSPINQADMLGTIMEFSLLWQRGAEMMGFHFEPEEREAVLHLWRYVGWVSGVEEELLEWISDYERAVRTAELVHLVQPGPDDDSLALAAALRQVPRRIARSRFEKMASRFVVPFHDGLTRAFNGDQIADDLRIPNAAWKHAITPTRAIVRTLERARLALPGATWLATELGNRRVRAQIAHILERREPTFTPPARIDETRGGRELRGAVA